MARDDWVAVCTEPGKEYIAWAELGRSDLRPYLPQGRRRWLPPGSSKYQVRRYPLFPRYLLLPIGDAKPAMLPTIRGTRGILRSRPVLTGENGSLWRAPDKVVCEMQAAEARGDFDELEFPPGTRVVISHGALSGIAATLERSQASLVELFTPLLGGARIRVHASRIASVAAGA